VEKLWGSPRNWRKSMSGMSAPWPQWSQDKCFFQGWYPFATDTLASGFSEAGGVGVIRLPAFPDMSGVSRRLANICRNQNGCVALDFRGVLGELPSCLDSMIHNLSCFLIHEYDLLPERLEAIKAWGLPRLVVVNNREEAVAAKNNGASALMATDGVDLIERLKQIIVASSLPCFAPITNDITYGRELLAQGACGLQLKSPSLISDKAAEFLGDFRKRLYASLKKDDFEDLIERPAPMLPSLKIRKIEVPYPIIQGGMGIGISWDRLAGSVANNGCIGIVSAIGTGYRYPGMVRTRYGRPDQQENTHSSEALKCIIDGALTISKGRGAVGVNVMCAINGYERVVRTSVESGAQLIISGAGLPLNLPSYVDDESVALVPIVSSARALRLICKSWERRYSRMPDAIVLEGPESGGHQGFSAEHCNNPDFALDAILPSVIQERNLWGKFPIIAAGGIWDRKDIDRLFAIGAEGVQMGTRFIGTFECDAHPNFKEIILQSTKSTIKLHDSPVGMPARGVITELHKKIADGTAPKVKCISNCITPCEHGKGAIKVGYCIADRLADSMNGDKELGLFFTGSSGWKLRDLIPVRDLISEITEDYGLSKLSVYDETSPGITK